MTATAAPPEPATGVVSTSQQLDAIAKALNKAQQSVTAIVKDAENKHFNYRYASAEQIISETRGALIENGLSVVPIDGEDSSDGPVGPDQQIGEIMRPTATRRSFLLLHTSGQWIAMRIAWPVIPQTGRPRDKAWAASNTTLLGYLLRDLLLLPRVDDENDRAVGPVPPGMAATPTTAVPPGMAPVAAPAPAPAAPPAAAQRPGGYPMPPVAAAPAPAANPALAAPPKPATQPQAAKPAAPPAAAPTPAPAAPPPAAARPITTPELQGMILRSKDAQMKKNVTREQWIAGINAAAGFELISQAGLQMKLVTPEVAARLAPYVAGLL